MYVEKYGGQPYGKCMILYQDNELPLSLKQTFSTTWVKPKTTHSWFEGEYMQMDQVQNILGMLGQGMNVEIMDGGTADLSNQELSGHAQNLDATGSDPHATSTTGIVVAQGATNAQYKGMAPGAYAYVRDYNGDIFSEKEMDFPAYNIAADNNSWGYVLGWTWGSKNKPQFYCYNSSEYVADGFGDYDNYAKEMDNLILPIGSEPLKTVVVFSSGNDRGEIYSPAIYGGHNHCYCPDSTSRCDSALHTDEHDPDPDYGSVGNLSCSKNALVVGAMYKDTMTNKYRLVSFSSSGPCNNGVMKPDFVAPGKDISTIGYAGYVDGTSFAAPYITGISAVVSQKWQEIWGELADVSIVRGFLAQTAEDLENPGPDYHFGYGLPQVRDAIELMDLTDHYTQGRVDSDMTQSYTITKNDSDPLRCTLSWLDYGGFYLSSDLDLSIVSGSTTYYPYLLDPNNPSFPATTGTDHQNVSEQVDVCATPPCSSTPPGTYTVNVFANWPIFTDGGHPYLLICSHSIGGGGEACNGAGEPNNSLSQAYYILYSGAYQTDLCPDGDVDYYTFDHFADGPMTLTLTGGTLDVTLTTLNGNPVDSGTSISQPNLARGSYVIKVASPTGTKVNYSMSLLKQDYAHRRPVS